MTNWPQAQDKALDDGQSARGCRSVVAYVEVVVALISYDAMESMSSVRIRPP